MRNPGGGATSMQQIVNKTVIKIVLEVKLKLIYLNNKIKITNFTLNEYKSAQFQKITQHSINVSCIRNLSNKSTM